MRRGGALVLGGVVLAAAIVFASRPLGVAGLGLLLAALVARAWVSFASGPIDVRTTISPDPSAEGDEVSLRIDAARRSRLPLGSAVVVGTLEGIGSYECRLRGHGGRMTGDLKLGALPRGLFEGADARIEIRDPLGLEVRSRPLGVSVSVLVQPRLVDLRGLFDDRGRLPGESQRFLMRRPSGYDLHSVREYEQGESLRRVHWPTTARRGQLMVKELEDSPRESLVVVLDCDPAGDAGISPESSFDAAVRAAGSILRVHVLRGRRCALVTTAQADCATRESSLEGEFASVLGTLAAVRADAPVDLGRFLERAPRSVSQSPEVVVVTATESAAAARGLLDLANRRAVAVVWVDAASYVGRPTRAAPAILRLSAAGIPIAVVRHGEDLATALEAPRGEARASG
jgi:uncharacterized protein (DUF58 family)